MKWTNLVNIANEQTTVGILAVGMTAVIMLGGIDLSVGSVLAASAGGLGIWVLNYVGASHSDLMAVLAAGAVTLAIGASAGFLNGMLIAKGRLAPFITTLCGLLAFRSVCGWIANSGAIFAFPRDRAFFAKLGRGIPIPHTNISQKTSRRTIPFEFPYAIVVWIVVAVIATIMINRTRLGRYIIAVGNNERAWARYSAIAVDRVKIITYTLLGLLTGLAALMEAARYPLR